MSIRIAGVLPLVCALACATANALTITGYSANANNRFSGGYPSAPIANTHPSFIGGNYDWSGVGWDAANPQGSFGFLSPQHYIAARHFTGSSTVDLLGGDGEVSSFTRQSMQNTGYGVPVSSGPDLSLGTLAESIAPTHQVARYAVLDLNNSSMTDTPSNYAGLPILVYGRGSSSTASPRIGAATILGAVSSGNDMYFGITRNDVQLQSGDSGSPVFASWTNPNGAPELAILGNNSAIDVENGYNFMNFLGTNAVMSQLNTMMNDEGWALRVVGNPSATWVGQLSTNISSGASWGQVSAPSDTFVLFDASTAVSRTVNMNTARTLRGLYFKASATGNDGFTVSGAGTLTIGRGGVTNYDADTQTFSAPIRLGSSQFWDGGAGGISANTIDTNGWLLEIGGSDTNRIQGAISGSGSLAVSGGRLVLDGVNSYTGATWIHSGRLEVNGSIASSSAVRLGSGAVLAGHGIVSTILGSGSVEPGGSPGILTAAALDPSAGLDFKFEFTILGSPDYANAAASGNDLLRLTGSTPFAQPLGAENVVSIFLDVASISPNDFFLGGFFTDRNEAFLGQIEAATFLFYIANGSEDIDYDGVSYSLYDGPLTFQINTVADFANFAGGGVNGWVMTITVVPEPSECAVAVVLFLFAAVVLRRNARA